MASGNDRRKGGAARGKNPLEHTVQDCMSQPAITAHPDMTLTDVMTTMERHQIRRVPVVDDHERCVGIVAQADLAWAGPQRDVAVLVREVSWEYRQIPAYTETQAFR